MHGTTMNICHLFGTVAIIVLCAVKQMRLTKQESTFVLVQFGITREYQ